MKLKTIIPVHQDNFIILFFKIDFIRSFIHEKKNYTSI